MTPAARSLATNPGAPMNAKPKSNTGTALPFAHFLGLPRNKAFTPIPIGGAGGKSAQERPAAKTPKAAASTSARSSKAPTSNFAHLLPTAEQRARYQSAGLGADNAAAPDRDPDAELAARIVAAGKRRRGET